MIFETLGRMLVAMVAQTIVQTIKTTYQWITGTFPPTSVKVLDVIDGDSLLGLSKEGKTYEIRVRGLDAPEIGQEGAEAASRKMAQLTIGKTVELIAPENDHYGRIAADVITPSGEEPAVELIEEGLAHACERHGAWRHKDAEMDARDAQKGIWKDGNKPEYPADYRAKHPVPIRKRKPNETLEI